MPHPIDALDAFLETNPKRSKENAVIADALTLKDLEFNFLLEGQIAERTVFADILEKQGFEIFRSSIRKKEWREKNINLLDVRKIIMANIKVLDRFLETEGFKLKPYEQAKVDKAKAGYERAIKRK